MADINVCPLCGGELAAYSIGWKCRGCHGFFDMEGHLHEHEEKPFMPPQTNADRIRAMSDEELGLFLGEWWYAETCWRGDGAGEVLAWLQEPAEEVHHE